MPPSLPFLAPDLTCNARLHRSSGYCPLAAGHGTDHPGVGRCRLHGGLGAREGGTDGTREQFMALGLGPILNLAETMTSQDQEYLAHVTDNALVVARAKIAARMQHADTSAKEMADLTMALSRLDIIIAKYQADEDPDKAPNTADATEALELERLAAIDAFVT